VEDCLNEFNKMLVVSNPLESELKSCTHFIKQDKKKLPKSRK